MARITKECITKKVSLSNSALNDYLERVIRNLQDVLRYATAHGYKDVTLESYGDEDGPVLEVWGNRKETKKEEAKRIRDEKRAKQLRTVLMMLKRAHPSVARFAKALREFERLS